MASADFSRRIAAIVGRWEGVTVNERRFGGVEFRVGHREIGHLHGARQADLPFPVRIRRALVASGRAEAHPALPKTGWVSYRIRSEHDIPAVLDLFRMNYDRLRGATALNAPLPMLGRPVLLGDRTADDLPA